MRFVQPRIRRALCIPAATVLLAASLTMAVGLLQSAPALAATGTCSSDYSCYWASTSENNNPYSGSSPNPADFAQSNNFWGGYSSHGACVAGVTAASDNDGGWSDCASSGRNGESHSMVLYNDEGCTGTSLTLDGGQTINSFVTSDPDVNDIVSADHYPGSGSCPS
jgi:hypothetical protein